MNDSWFKSCRCTITSSGSLFAWAWGVGRTMTDPSPLNFAVVPDWNYITVVDLPTLLKHQQWIYNVLFMSKDTTISTPSVHFFFYHFCKMFIHKKLIACDIYSSNTSGESCLYASLWTVCLKFVSIPYSVCYTVELHEVWYRNFLMLYAHFQPLSLYFPLNYTIVIKIITSLSLIKHVFIH